MPNKTYINIQIKSAVIIEINHKVIHNNYTLIIMSKVLAVFGAAGIQGSSVINHILNDPILSKEYTIRAITRNVTSDAAKTLSEKVTVVQGDFTDPPSLSTALSGAHTVFAMTMPVFTSDVQSNYDAEYNSGKIIADASVSSGAEYIIFSTLPSPSAISGGKYKAVHHFDSKAAIEEYIRSLPVRSAFISLGAFMTNFAQMPPFKPQKEGDEWVLSLPRAGEALMPLIEAVEDTGKFVGAILAEPEKYEGKTFCAAEGLYSMEEIAGAMAEATGEKVVYRGVGTKEFIAKLAGMPPAIVEVFQYGDEFGGYYGPKTEEVVRWAIENARGKLTSLKEYLEKSDFKLE